MNTYRITYTDMNERVGVVDIVGYSAREALSAFESDMSKAGDEESWILESIRLIK